MIRPLLVSTSDLRHGAGIAAFRLHRGLSAAGIDSRMLVTDKLSTNPAVLQVPPLPRTLPGQLARNALHWCENAISALGIQGCFSVATPSLMRHSWMKSSDLVHLHNIHWHSRNFSLLMLPYLSRKKPVVWTIHDMWPFTGHCYNPVECERWRKGCGKCPDLASYIRLLLDSTAALVKLKRNVVMKSNMVIVCPSRWMKGVALESQVFAGQDVRYIANGVDTDVFHPYDPLVVRTKWGIPISKQVILFVAAQVDDPRKGYALFLEALSRLTLPKEKLLILTMGGGKLPDGDSISGIAVKSIGYLPNEDSMAELYAAADVLAMPSLQENLPNVVLESLACGTPVVCFDNSGQKEIIRHLENGYLARLGDSADLAAGIAYVLDRRGNGQVLRNEARNTVLNSFSLRDMVQHHSELYSELCDNARRI